MESKSIYKKLDNKFIKQGLTDDWYQYMKSLNDYITPKFKKTNMGIMFDFNSEIEKVYTATFPSENILSKVLDLNEYNIMLFTHHASEWDSNLKIPFKNISIEKAKLLKEKNISIYVIHVPLDNFSEFSTGNSFAKKLDLDVLKPFANYRGAKSGVICQTNFKSIDKLNKKVENIVGHKCKLYDYGNSQISNNKVAIITGGGNDIQFLKEVKEMDINTFITGVTNKNITLKAHKYAKKNNINIIGATHYSTEKFACSNMVNYFRKLGLKSEFLKDKPVLNDL